MPNCVSTVLLRFAMLILSCCIEGRVDCYYILILLDSSPSAPHKLEVAVFCFFRVLPAVLCLKMRHCVVIITDP
jgi:hypothetical protein